MDECEWFMLLFLLLCQNIWEISIKGGLICQDSWYQGAWVRHGGEQGRRSGSIYGHSNIQHRISYLVRSRNFSSFQDSALLAYISQVGPKSQRFHTSPRQQPHLGTVPNLSDPRHSNFLKYMAHEARKVVYANSEDVSSLRKFILLVFQTEAKSQMTWCHSV